MKSATTMHAGLGLVFLHYLKYQVDENSEMAKQVKKTLKANQFKKKKKVMCLICLYHNLPYAFRKSTPFTWHRTV